MFQKYLTAVDWKAQARCSWPALLFMALYVAGAQIGHALSFVDAFPTLWPPSGILLAALLISDVRRWPNVLLLALAANLISDVTWRDCSVAFSMSHWLVTAAEAILGAGLMRKLCSGPITCESVREVLGLSFAASVLTTLLGAFAGAGVLARWLNESNESLTWSLWWNSHMLGSILFAPTVIMLDAQRTKRTAARITWKLAAEACLAFTLLTIFACLVYSPDTQPHSFLVFPVLIWISLRLELWGTCVGNLIRVAIAICSTRVGYGPFAGNYPAAEQAIILSSFLSITCTTALFLTAIVSERRKNSYALQQSELRYRDLLENIGELVHSVNAQGTILYTNRAWRETLGYSQAEVAHMSMYQVVHPDDLERYRLKLVRVLSGECADRYEFRFLTRDGRTLVVEGTCNCRIVEGQPNATRSIYRDVTKRREHEAQLDLYRRQLEEANVQLHHLATTDGLTGLHNRRSFEERLREEIERAKRHGHDVSVLMVDVDHFKQVNDVFGHAAGDVVLRRVAEIMQANAREYDFVARIGGEEFALILPKVDEPGSRTAAERLRARIATLVYSGRQITASLGVATLDHEYATPDPDADGRALMKVADTALYYSKQHGRNRVTHAAGLASVDDWPQFDNVDNDSFYFELVK